MQTDHPATLEARLADWDGLAVVSRFDPETGSWIFIHLHDDRLGPCTGGTRMKHYPVLSDAVDDGQRLAEGMTHKWAAVGMPFGGGKAVIATPPILEASARSGLLQRYGRLLESLRGTFWTGEDLGTTTQDMATVAASCRYIHGFDPATGEKTDPSPYTAHAVHAGIVAACAQVFGSSDLKDRRILVQGLGNVGSNLARQLAADGATVLVSDLDGAARDRVAEEIGAEIVPPGAICDTVCDLYAPCAVGAVLSEETIPRLRCRIVAGSANNQLATSRDAERLHERGIVYVPDYIINAGGAMAFALLQEVGSGEPLMRRVEAVGHTVRDILAEASQAGESPVHAARRRVERQLAHPAR